MDQKRYPPAALAWLVWGLGAAFYFAGFFHRVAPAVMIDHLMADFHIGAAELGNFSAFYFYSYFLMQVPTGILSDYWGPRRLLTAGALVGACGTFLFASASAISTANLARLLVGGAAGVAYVSLLQLSTRWFAPRFFATVIGIALFCGVGGAVSAGVPLHFLVSHFGWRPVMFGVSAVLLLIGAAVWTIVRDDPAERGYRSFFPPGPKAAFSAAALRRDLITILGYRNTWFISLVGCGLTGPVLTFAGLWGVPFLTTLYGMPTAASSAITSTLLICYAVGAIGLGMLSDRIGLRKPVMLAGSAVAFLCWIPILFFPRLPHELLIALVIIEGLSAGTVTLGFAFLKETLPARFAGTVSGIYNMGSILGAMILQPAVGWLLDFAWRGTLSGGARIYDPDAYRLGFLPIAAFAAVALLSIGFASETGSRRREDREDGGENCG